MAPSHLLANQPATCRRGTCVAPRRGFHRSVVHKVLAQIFLDDVRGTYLVGYRLSLSLNPHAYQQIRQFYTAVKVIKIAYEYDATPSPVYLSSDICLKLFT